MSRVKSDIPFVGLHAHSVAGSVFDALGFPQDHMDFAYENGNDALALTDHGNMNGLAYQVLHAKKMKSQGKEFKPIYGCEAYFVPSVTEWREEYERAKEDKKRARALAKSQAGLSVEDEGATKSGNNNILNRRRHLVLIAQNQTGLNNLFRLISDSYTEEYFYRYPRIDYDLLKKYGEGIIAASACLGGVYAGCLWENREQGDEAVLEAMREVTRKMMDIFGDRWYGELQWNNVPEQHQLNKFIIQMSEEFGFKLISTADSHYPTPTAWKDRELYKRLGWLGRGMPKWAEGNTDLPEGVEEIGYELYPKNGDQMFASYKLYSEEGDYDDQLVLDSIKETHNIAFNRIEAFTPDNTIRLPDFVVPAGFSADDALAKLSLDGLKDVMGWTADTKVGEKQKEYIERLHHELDVISNRGFSKYFLTMKAVSDKAKEVQLVGPGRGSAAGSLVAYALGITQVDPIKYGLLFARFLRSDATDYPDIDYDISNPMELKEMLIEAWGNTTVVPISNWNTLQLKSLVKDVSKFYGIPFLEANAVTSKMVFEATGPAKKKHGIKTGVYTPTFEELKEFSPTLSAFLAKYPHIAEHIEALLGQVRSQSRHAGGVVIGENLDEYMPMVSSGGVRQTPWSEGQNVRHLEPMGFIKFDLLGLKTLRVMENCIRLVLKRHKGIEDPTFEQIKEYYDTVLHPDVLKLNDQKVFRNVFQKGKWVGVFQFTEDGAQNLCMQARPKSIVDLAAITSIYRPGPLGANVDKDYVEARKNPEYVTYSCDEVQNVTSETMGFLIFQEQIAQLAYQLGKDITMDEANLLRKVLTKKGTGKGAEVKNRIYKKFIDGCVEKFYGANFGDELWKKFEYFAGYGFNKSHAVSYSLISYQCAWLLNYYESEWMAAYLDNEPESKKERAIATAKQYGFEITNVDINNSTQFWEIDPEDDHTLIQPLTSLKGLGDKAIEQVLMHRPFNTIEEFLFHEDVVYSKLNKKALSVLARAGALNSLMDDRFSGGKHFFLAVAENRPKTKKKFNEGIEAHRSAGAYTYDEKLANIIDLTGQFPISMIVSDDVLRRLAQKPEIVPLSEFDAISGHLAWGIVKTVTPKKTKNGKDYLVVDVVDINSVVSRVRVWGVDPRIDIIHVNRPYMIVPKYDPNWGFSTRGSVRRKWALLG